MDSVFRELFGARLREVRKAMGLTQAEFGEKSGIARGSVTYYERQEPDKTRLPDAETLRKICLTTGISSDYFLGLTDERKEYDLNISKVCQYLGLSREAVLWINQNNSDEYETNKTLDLLLRCAATSQSFHSLLQGIELYCSLASSLVLSRERGQNGERNEEDEADFAYAQQKLVGMGYFPVRIELYQKTIYDSIIPKDMENLIKEVLDRYTEERKECEKEC